MSVLLLLKSSWGNDRIFVGNLRFLGNAAITEWWKWSLLSLTDPQHFVKKLWSLVIIPAQTDQIIYCAWLQFTQSVLVCMPLSSVKSRDCSGGDLWQFRLKLGPCYLLPANRYMLCPYVSWLCKRCGSRFARIPWNFFWDEWGNSWKLCLWWQ